MSPNTYARKIHERIRRLYADLSTDFADYDTVDFDDPRFKELEQLITDPDLTFYHATSGEHDLYKNPDLDHREYWEANPGAFDTFLHAGTDQAAWERLQQADWEMDAAENIDSYKLKTPEPYPILPPARFVPMNVRVKPEEIMWGNDNGLVSTLDHLLAGVNVPPAGTSYPVLRNEFNWHDGPVDPTDVKTGGPGFHHMQVNFGDPQWIDNSPENKARAEKLLNDHGIRAIAYPNTVEDTGSISIIPVGPNTVYNAITGERIKQVAGTAGAAGLLAAVTPEEAIAEMDPDAELAKLQMAHQLVTGQGPKEEDYTNELLRQATEAAYKETRPSMRMKALMEIMAWRQRLNQDIREHPLKSLASIPVGAAEEVWDTANMLGRGWSWLDHLVDQNDKPTKVDAALDWSEKHRENVRDYLTDELGLPQTVRTAGGITGVGGIATKGAKKGAETLYDLYRLGL